MLVVSDLKELSLPDNLLVNLQESRAVVETFLDSLPDMFVKNRLSRNHVWDQRSRRRSRSRSRLAARCVFFNPLCRILVTVP
jgi:hypothetical protein